MPIAYVGLGSNLEPRVQRLAQALGEIQNSSAVEVLSTSSLYETEPVGVTFQPWFLNAVAEVRTLLNPEELLFLLQGIENRMGRRRGMRWGPRNIDLDILLYENRIVRSESLIIPHPELHRRRFVLVPLTEIAGNRRHPILYKTVATLLEELGGGGSVRLVSSPLQWGR